MAGSSSSRNKRFCDLPDAILIHILSFLPTNSAVSTSLLSRRWRYLWTSTPNLQLDESQFKPDRDKFITPHMDYYFNYDHDKLMNFAERALVLRGGSSLVSFSLSCSVRNDESRINTLITSAIQHNVEQLSLSLRGYEDSFFLPSCIFGCQSLVKLDLQMMSSSVTITSMICLPRLKHLSLRAVEFADNESAERLLSHPMLEELILCNCTWYNITTVNVNSPKLQSLSIIDECIKDDWFEDDWPEDDWSEEQQVCFVGDNLNLFHYKGVLPPTQYCICGSTMQLMEAVILVQFHDHKVHKMDGPSSRYCKLVNSLSWVQNLTLSEDTAKSLYQLSQCPWLQTTLPVFDRVTQLNLKGGFDPEAISLDSACLKMLYSRCPHLEHLNLMDRITLEFTAPILRPMPSCFRTHLKKVTLPIDEPESDDEGDYQNCCDQNALNLLFDSAPVLEEVVIHWKMDDWIIGCPSTGQVSRVEELEPELNARPKASENCRVFIVFV